MNIQLNRLDPNLPDPVESRRRSAGRMIRIFYTSFVFGVFGFFVIYLSAPLVFLSGPGTVTARRHVISLPYTVQVVDLAVEPGAAVKAGENLGHVRSPQQDEIVATYMRALAELAGREAEVRIRARVARDALDAAQALLRITEQAVRRIEDADKKDSTSLAYRIDAYRARAQALHSVVSQEAEAAESFVQLGALAEIRKRLEDRLGRTEKDFGAGAIVSPINGVVAPELARVGQSLVAGSSVAEILDPADVYVQWHVPDYRLFDPVPGHAVFVLYGNRRIDGRIVQILPLSDVFRGAQPSSEREQYSAQIARIRLSPDAELPPLNASVQVRMYYADIAYRIAGMIVNLLSLR